jgi:hypothetical protein
MRHGRGRIGRGLAIDGVRLHQLDAGAVGIVEVDLALAVDADLDFDGLAVGRGVEAFGCALFDLGQGLFGIRNGKADVVLGAAAARLRELVVEHELQVGIALGRLDVDPAQHAGGGSYRARIPGSPECRHKRRVTGDDESGKELVGHGCLTIGALCITITGIARSLHYGFSTAT